MKKVTVIVRLVSMIFLSMTMVLASVEMDTKRRETLLSDEIVLNTTMVLYFLNPYAEWILVLELYIFLRVFTV
jgi:hypothetical protein